MDQAVLIDFMELAGPVLTVLGLTALFVAQVRVGAHREWRNLAKVREQTNADLTAEVTKLKSRIEKLEAQQSHLLEMLEAGIAERVAQAVLVHLTDDDVE